MAKLITFSYPDEQEEIFKKFREIAKREGGPAKIFQEIVKDYVKKHGEGNPNYTVDKWVNNPDFHAMPTLGEDPERYGVEKWTDKEITELCIQLVKWNDKVKRVSYQRGKLWRP